MKWTLALLLALALAGCSGGMTSVQRAAIDQALATAPGQAQPSRLVAVELAAGRAAREDGQWVALREYAAPGAVLHLAEGLVEADSWLRGRAEPDAPLRWTPTAIWMSCDGAAVVSRGEYLRPNGQWGSYAAVWQRQRNGDYRWAYATGGVNSELTARKQRTAQRVGQDGEIVVEASGMISGEVADCQSSATPPQPPAGASVSADRTLSWQWSQQADGGRLFQASELTGGQWQPVLSLEVGSNGEVLSAE